MGWLRVCVLMGDEKTEEEEEMQSPVSWLIYDILASIHVVMGRYSS